MIPASLRRTLCLVLLPILPAFGQNAVPIPADRLSGTGAELAWWSSVPKGLTVSIRSYSLLDGHLYAIGTDGEVRAFRADNGQFLWATPVAHHEAMVYPPVAYRGNNMNAVIFSHISEAALVDEANGLILKKIELKSATSTSVIAGPVLIYATGADRRITAYNVTTGFPRWQIQAHGPITIPPLYIPWESLICYADENGRVSAGYAGRKKQFVTKLDGRPQGWMTADRDALYVATSGTKPRLHALDFVKGEPFREPFILEGQPKGGPVVTARAVYQAVAPAGLHCVGLKPGVRSWCHRGATTFLAEWPGRVVVLRADGRVQMVDADTGLPAAPLEIGTFAQGVSNPYNDAVILAAAGAEIRCLRPENAKPLTLADFKPVVTTRPSTEPAAQPSASPAEEAPPATPAEEPAPSPEPEAETPPAESTAEPSAPEITETPAPEAEAAPEPSNEPAPEVTETNQ